MASPTQLLTKLDAVNMMLASIGQAPVNSLAVTGIRDVAIATLALDNTTREVLLHGWNFNTDWDYPLAPNAQGHIVIPHGVLDLDPVDKTKDCVIRWSGGEARLYDKDNRTFVFDGIVRCNVIWGFEFEELPQAARQYIAIRAARIFQSQVIGSDILFRFTEDHEAEALALLARSESRNKDKNFFASGADVNRIFDRLSVPVRF